MRAILAGGGEEYVPFAGQSAGLVHEILPAAEIVRRVIAEAERVLADLSTGAGSDAPHESYPTGRSWRLEGCLRPAQTGSR